jgi:hypothetical protein
MTMDGDELLRQGLADLAEGAGWTDLQDRVQRASRRLAWRRRALTSLAAVTVAAVAAVPIVLAGSDRGGKGAPIAAPPPSASPTPSVSPSAGSPSATPQNTSPTAGHSSPAAADTGCPVSAKALQPALAAALAAYGGDHVGQTYLGKPTSLTNVVCYRRYAVATPVPKVGTTRILFGYELPERKWIALNAGTTGLCDSYVLDGTISARLPGC